MKQIRVVLTMLAVALYFSNLPLMAQQGRGAGGPPAGVGARGPVGQPGAPGQAGRPGGPPGLSSGGQPRIGANAGGPPAGGPSALSNRGNQGNGEQGPSSNVAGGQSGRPENPGPPSDGAPGQANQGGQGNQTQEANGNNAGDGPPATGDLLAQNPQLAERLAGLLPPGTDLIDAADGFRNFGQFVAAVNVSNNLGIPFDELKGKMVGEELSMGEAIQALSPDVAPEVEVPEVDADGGEAPE